MSLTGLGTDCFSLVQSLHNVEGIMDLVALHVHDYDLLFHLPPAQLPQLSPLPYTQPTPLSHSGRLEPWILRIYELLEGCEIVLNSEVNLASN